MKHVNRLVATAALAVTLGSIHSSPSEALMCQNIGASACLSLLDQAVNKQSFVEAWVTNQYNNYATRNCPGGPSSSGTYTFYGRSINKSGDVTDILKPNISCNECDALSRISGLIDGYLGQCSPTDDNSWVFVGHFCGLPTGGGALYIRRDLSMDDAAVLFLGCNLITDPSTGTVVTTVSACSSAGGCLD